MSSTGLSQECDPNFDFPLWSPFQWNVDQGQSVFPGLLGGMTTFPFLMPNMTLSTEIKIAPSPSTPWARMNSTIVGGAPASATKTLEEIKAKARNKIKARHSPRMSSNTTEVRAEVMDSDLENLLAEGRTAAQIGALSGQPIAEGRCISQVSSEEVLEDVVGHRAPAGYQSEDNGKHQMEVVKNEDDKYTVDEIDEWLTLTGFYDAPYRRKLLSGRRRMKAIEEEKQQLLQEEQEETSRRRAIAHPSQAQDIVPSRETPPPDDGSSFKVKGDAAMARKRAYNGEGHDDVQPAKMARFKAPLTDPRNGDRKELGSVRPQKQQPLTEQEHLYPNKVRLGENRVLARCSPRTSDQDGLQVAGRWGGRDLIDDYPRRSIPKDFDRRLGDRRHGPSSTRFFMLRSWNRDNIAVAQRECAWATQLPNEQAFVDAFQGSRRVVFFFSANGSKAFQGHAEMTSLPAAPGIPDPKWRSQLHWPSTEAFGLKWIGTSETAHVLTAHLKNPWNQGLPVYVGKDGQEIEPGIGAKLCEILEDCEKRKRNRLHR